MKAPPFRLVRPTSIDDALAIKAQHGAAARFLAGGQSLLPILNFRLAQPEVLIDLNGLATLGGVTEQGAVVRIGALVRHRAIAADPVLARALPLLPATVPWIAHAAIRTRGTFGGSVALGDPAAEWPACCVALDAVIVARSAAGERRIAARDFFLSAYTTALAEDELLVAVEISAVPGAQVAALEFARRRGDYALAGLVANRHEGRVRHAFFGVADRPVRLAAVDDALSAGDVAAAQAAVTAGLDARGDAVTSVAARTQLARVLVARAAHDLGLVRAAA